MLGGVDDGTTAGWVLDIFQAEWDVGIPYLLHGEGMDDLLGLVLMVQGIPITHTHFTSIVRELGCLFQGQGGE